MPQVFGCVCVFIAPRELNNFGKLYPLNSVPLLSCLSCFRLLGLVFNYLVNKEVDDRGNNTTFSSASCFTNGMYGVCKLLDESFGIEYGTMTPIHSDNGDKMISDGRNSDLLRDRVGALNIVPNFI